MMGGRGFGDYGVGIGGGSGDHSRGCVGDRGVRGAVGSGREVVPQLTAIINVVSVTRPGRVHGTEVHDVILDTGCIHTLVQQHLIRKGSDAYTVTWYPLADVELQMDGIPLKVLSQNLPISGTHVPELGRLLRANPHTIHTEGTDEALVVTRPTKGSKRRLTAKGVMQKVKPLSGQTLY